MPVSVDRLLIVGGTGTLGVALRRVACARGFAVRTLSRGGDDISLDATDGAAIREMIMVVRPRLIVNCAAVTDIDQCEREPDAAMRINAEAPGRLAAAAREQGGAFVQVSTDHFFTGDGAALHDENAPVQLVNEYARSKYAGEQGALGIAGTLVVRTNFTGWRGWPNRPTFLEWAVAALERDEPVTGFSDFFTSTIDADSLAAAVLDLAAKKASGIYNVASSEVADKAKFLRCLAREIGVPADRVRDGSVRSLATERAESLGLDVRKAETLLGRSLPDLKAVVAALCRSKAETRCAS